ncbi:MAG: glycosyltransferase [Flavobacteriales bacterium]|nr:glycosyltransferase [Flavobacteriales bacterium]MBT7726361.1 glycosyltransferase [Flavobacteriales bacterium]
MKRKVIIIGPAFPYRGGIANFNNSLAVEYQNQGVDVQVYSFSLQYPSFLFPGKTQYEEGEGPDGIKIFPIINSVNPFNWFKIARKVRNENPDYVIIRYWLPFMAPCLGTIAKLIRKTTKVFAITDNVIPHEQRIGDNLLTRYFVKSCDAFLTLSSSVLDDLLKFTNTKEKIFIPHPIYDSFGEIVEKDKARKNLGLDENGKYLLFFGFVRKYKGLDVMIDVMADRRIKDLGVKLIVAGEFYENKEEYISQIDVLGINDSVILKSDFIPEEEVKDYFCASDMITQTYRTATQSGVTQIAYHFERPMLVTNVGGLAEIVPHNKVGYVCDINTKYIADSIVEFYSEEKEEEFTKNTKEEKLRFTWSELVKGVDNLIKKQL